ncbi:MULTISPECIES: type II toxin-antitoxin system HicB family antitoxin [Marinobacter]|uniref:Type II toxin-antitoxin system HicB family antitoxin n=1 Tax=Marinobacter metalliresistant TaxID=2961995 RepID=A0ABZ2W2Y3_9GAMM|nr:type II toxin-antitoxin system HicB family antitoxin [Marinobacter sp. Arc7-DN-1]AXS81602.1 type II toxin-antitoxin system HicB family antitoxin [Marinobacter sp. Arc7-DN-1]
MFYPILIQQEGDSAYGVIVPDLPGCHSAGDTFNEAVENAAEAIDFHMETMAEEGIEIPAASDLGELTGNPNYANGVWVMVQVDVVRYLGTAQRINISLPNRLITQIDRFVDTHKDYKDRSKFLADAAMKILQHV